MCVDVGVRVHLPVPECVYDVCMGVCVRVHVYGVCVWVVVCNSFLPMIETPRCEREVSIMGSVGSLSWAGNYYRQVWLCHSTLRPQWSQRVVWGLA